MPVPVLIWIGFGVVSLLAGTTLAWDKIQIALRGQRLAVLGARGVGKTHLIRFLTTGSIPLEYRQTLAPGKIAAKRLQLRDLDLKVKDMLDVSGDKAAYGDWKEQHDQADIVFYLLRADKLISKDPATESRVRADLTHIGSWLTAKQPRPKFFIVGTHCDLDNEFANCSDKNFGDYRDRFQRLPVISELVAHGGGSQQAKVVLGSMRTAEGTEALVYQIFRQVNT